MDTNSTSSVHSVRAIGTIWELPPAQRALFIADRSGSFCGIHYMHTKAFGWSMSIGDRSFKPEWIGFGLGGCLLLFCVLLFLFRFIRRPS